MAETNRVGVSAMLSADAKLEFFAGLAPPFCRNLNELAHAFDIERHKRIARDHALAQIVVQEHAGIVAANADGGLRQIVGAEGEELRRLGDVAGAQRRARQFRALSL